MAKKKKRKETSKKGFDHYEELIGVILLILTILSIVPEPLGLVGKMGASFAMFLVGTGYQILLFGVFLLGCYLVYKREWPNFFTTRLIGIYSLVLGLMVLAHLSFVQENGGDIAKAFKATVDVLIRNFGNVTNGGILTLTGSGMIGVVVSSLFYKLFDVNGTYIVAFVFIIVGLLLMTGISFGDVLKKFFSKFHRKNKVKGAEKEKKVIVNDSSQEEEPAITTVEDKKIMIHSIDELTHVKEEPAKEVPLPETEIAPVIHDHNPSEGIVQQNLKYKLPPLSILTPTKKTKSSNNEVIERNIEKLEQVLKDFGIFGKVVEVNVGPSVTQYELEINSGTKVSKILSLNKEISLALAKRDVRIQAPIPGKSTVGIELANDSTSPVGLKEILETVPGNKTNSKLLVALGKNIMGNSVYCEIDKTPHLLVAGSTGSGKSVCINCMIASILMRTKPSEVKLVLVDPKKVELSMYNGVPHLLIPVVTDPRKANDALKKIVREMEIRYDKFADKGVKNISTYNEWVDKQNEGLPDDAKMAHMTYIVVIVDELADLMVVAGKEVEDSIMRIAQMARAAGIHMILATQRPSTDVITGVVKANIPSRISFAVSSSIDSRTILDATGAEKLLGKGDMLFLPMGENAALRVQGAYVSDEDLEKIVNYTVAQQKAQYDESFMNLNAGEDDRASMEDVRNAPEEYDDPLYNEIVEFAIMSGKISASLIQRKYRLGYNRAARIVDLLEERGIIGPANGSKPREVLVKLDHGQEEE